MVFISMLSRLGISDVPSYFRKLRIPIVIGAVVCACIGASDSGLGGLLIGGLLGLFAPAALLFGITIFLTVYFAVWAVIVYALWWLFGS